MCGDGVDHKRTTCADCLSASVQERRQLLQQRTEECEPLRAKIKVYVEKRKPRLRKNIANDLRASRIAILKERIAFTKQCIEEGMLLYLRLVCIRKGWFHYYELVVLVC